MKTLIILNMFLLISFSICNYNRRLRYNKFWSNWNSWTDSFPVNNYHELTIEWSTGNLEHTSNSQEVDLTGDAPSYLTNSWKLEQIDIINANSISVKKNNDIDLYLHTYSGFLFRLDGTFPHTNYVIWTLNQPTCYSDVANGCTLDFRMKQFKNYNAALNFFNSSYFGQSTINFVGIFNSYECKGFKKVNSGTGCINDKSNFEDFIKGSTDTDLGTCLSA